VSPDELFRDGIFRYVSKLVKVGPTLEVDVQAVAKAEFFLALESVRLSAERVLD
jgi:hypothetical protein